MSRALIAGAIALALLCAGCDGVTPAQLKTAARIGCLVDGVVQPIAAPALASVPDVGTAVFSVDTALLHPAIVAACKAADGVPVAEMP